MLTHFIAGLHIFLPNVRYWMMDIKNPAQWLYVQKLENSTMTEQYFAAYFRGISFSLGTLLTNFYEILTNSS